MHILIAPNAYKNSLTAREAAIAILKGLQLSKLPCTCECFPIGDGGDGTGELLIEKFKGQLIGADLCDPLGRKVTASFGLIDDGRTAVIEMANASGIRLLRPDELDPLQASSFGTGEMIRIALDEGVKKIILALGGSATVDGGCGILQALGVRFLNAKGNALQARPGNLADLAGIDLSGLDQRILACELVVLCDVDNTLSGDKGAASVFGPQKGANMEGIKKLESFLSALRAIALKETGKDMAAVKYGGAAGGAAAGLYAFLNAKLVNGADYFLQLTGFEKSLQRSDIVITGEGSIDEQTLQGKGPFAVAFRAKNKNIPVIGLAGKVPVKENPLLKEYFNILMAIGNEPTDMNTAIRFTADNLIRSSQEIGDLIALMK
jgi:glycerate kinase